MKRKQTQLLLKLAKETNAANDGIPTIWKKVPIRDFSESKNKEGKNQLKTEIGPHSSNKENMNTNADGAGELSAETPHLETESEPAFSEVLVEQFCGPRDDLDNPGLDADGAGELSAETPHLETESGPAFSEVLVEQFCGPRDDLDNPGLDADGACELSAETPHLETESGPAFSEVLVEQFCGPRDDLENPGLGADGIGEFSPVAPHLETESGPACLEIPDRDIQGLEKDSINNKICQDVELEAGPSNMEIVGTRSAKYYGLSTTEIINDRMSHSTNSISNSRGSSDSGDDYSSDDSIKDPHYWVTVSSSSSDVEENSEDQVHQNEQVLHAMEPVGEPNTENKGRKRKANPSEWKQNKAKILRNSGKAYVTKTKKVVMERKMGPICNEKCTLKCSTKIDHETRQLLFTSYWSLGNIDTQRNYISSSMSIVDPVLRHVKPNSTRKKNRMFHFEIQGKKTRVCKFYFKSTLGISDRAIRTTISKQNNQVTNITATDNRGKHGKHKKLDATIKDGVREDIKSIPQIESHYCRANTTKKFIQGGLTLADLHRNYVNRCQDNGVPFASYQVYYSIFNEEFNLSFWTPKKDQCEDCTAFKNAEDKTPLQVMYDRHHKEKDLSRIEKENDKKLVSKNTIVAVYDLQAVMPCPRGEVSTFYYVSKINLYNFTIFEMQTNKVKCFVWHEGEGKRGANEIGSCVLQHLQSLQNSATERFDVIYYSDNCCGQQKNKFIISLYMHAVSTLGYLNSITHKFLIKGHSQNEGDSVHSTIERKIKDALKVGPIYVPDQYIQLIRSAKIKAPMYNVHELSHDDFYDLKKIASETGTNFSVDQNNEKQKMNDFKVIKVEKIEPDKFFFKTSYEDKEFRGITVNKSRRRSKVTTLNKLYNSKLEIVDKKKQGILKKEQSLNTTKPFIKTSKIVYVR